MAELRAELEEVESAQATASALPSQIKSFVESLEELETSKAKTILKSVHVWRGGKIELGFR